jgi:hypothetical protein
MSHGGGGSKKCGKSVTYYLNGPLLSILIKTTSIWSSTAPYADRIGTLKLLTVISTEKMRTLT